MYPFIFFFVAFTAFPPDESFEVAESQLYSVDFLLRVLMSCSTQRQVKGRTWFPASLPTGLPASQIPIFSLGPKTAKKSAASSVP